MPLGNALTGSYASLMALQPETPAEWVARWKRIGPELERERQALFAPENARSAIEAFDGLVLLSLKSHPPLPYSGLIEQQRLFRRLRQEPPIIAEPTTSV
jgi:hypothetical protein